MVDKKLVYWIIGIIILIVVLLFVFGVVKVENGSVSFSPPGKLVKANANLQNPNWNNGGKDAGDLGGNLEKCNDPATAPECCNQRDDDRDYAIDCEDSDCHTDGNINNLLSCSILLTESGVMSCKSMDDDGTNGGFDPAVNGDTKLYLGDKEIGSYPEKCVDGKTLRSLYCNPDGHNERDFIRSKIVNCSGKCLDGACVDGGRNVVVSDNAFRVDLKKKVACNDGKDNDGDGAIDYPDDFSCSSSGDDDETNPKAECQDGFDNDGNGDIDYPDDVGCDSLQDNSESSVERVRFGNPNVNLGESLSEVGPSWISSDEFPQTLADGFFVTGEGISNSYQQYISVGDDTLFEHFRDSDYQDNPDLGISTKGNGYGGNYILTSGIAFTKKLYPKSKVVNDHLVDFEGQKIKMFGNGYIIIDSSASQKCLTFKRINDNERLDLCNGQNLKVNYIVVDDVRISLTINDDGNNIFYWNTLDFIWGSANQGNFITTTSDAIVPGLEKFRLYMTQFYTPESENFTVEQGGNTYVDLSSFPVKIGNFDLDILYGNGIIFTGVGRESGRGLQVPSGGNDTSFTNIVYDASSNSDRYFVATFDDGSNAESYVMRATSFSTNGDGTDQVDIEYRSDDSWKTVQSSVEAGDIVLIGNVSLTINSVSKAAKTVNITGGSNVNFNTLYTPEGLKVQLPYEYISTNYTADGSGLIGALETNTSADGYSAPTTYNLQFLEEDKNDNPSGGSSFNMTLGWASSKPTVSSISGDSGSEEVDNTNVYESYMYSALATKFLYDTGGDQDTVDVTYHGAESYGEFYLEVI